jgi:dTDP-4-dehydrorhamnose reductase
VIVDRILITGGKGALGTDLSSQLERENVEFLMTDIEGMDVRRADSVLKTVQDFQPDLVLHLAALTDVDFCEKNPAAAYLTNALGTQNVALACQALDIPLVYVSTISVFKGDKQEAYTEFDKPDPVSYYSKSKYAGELIVEKLLNNYYIVRAGWMFGGGLRDKKFVSKIMELAMAEGKLRVVDDKFGSPTYTRDFARGILNLVNTGAFGTYHMVNSGEYCNRFEFAEAVLRSARIMDCELVPISSAAFPLTAPRPRMEAARNLQLERRNWAWMPNWQDSLDTYIRKRLLPSMKADI